MRTSNITVAFEAEKALALKQYAAKKGLSVEAELQEAISRLYEKHVPAQVREYIENKPDMDEPPRSSRSRPVMP